MIEFYDSEKVTNKFSDLEALLARCCETGSTVMLPKSYYTEKLLGLCDYLKEGNTYFLVATEKNDVAGFLWAYEIRRTPKRVMHIAYFVVSEKYQKKGHGKTLMDAVEMIAKKKGIETLELNVKFTNINAIEYYKRCDFQAENITMSKKLY